MRQKRRNGDSKHERNMVLLALKMEAEGLEPRDAATSRLWERSQDKSQQENGDLGPTILRN